MRTGRRHAPWALLFLAACNGNSTGPVAAVAEVVVSPVSPAVDVGLTVQFSAQALSVGGAEIAGLAVTWSSSEAGVASISSVGLAQGVSIGSTAITATIGGVSASQVLTVEASQCQARVDVILPAGGSQFFDGDTCLFLPTGQAGDLYRVAVARPTLSENPSGVRTVMVAIDPIFPTVSAPPFTARPELESGAPSSVLGALPRLDGSRILEDVRVRARTRQFHYELRQRERELALGPEALLPRRPRRAPPIARVDPPARTTMYLDLDCDVVSLRPVILIDFDDDVAIYQDSVEWRTDPMSTAATSQMRSYYGNYVRGMLAQYWGDPPDVDGNGRLIIVTSPSLDAGVAAAVYSGDFSSPQFCASSNQGEVMYFQSSIIADLVDPSPSYLALGVMAHEAKHVVSVYNSLVRGSFHDIWIEEGTAEVSQVMSSRIAWAATGGPPIGAEIGANDILSAVNQNGGQETPEMSGVVNELAELILNLSTQPNSLVTNPDGAAEFHSFYASSWHWHRFIGDAFGDAATPFADAPLFRALTDSLNLGGPQGEAQVTGRSFDELFDDLIVAVNLHGHPQTPPLAFTTWDFVTATNIFSGPAGLTPAGVYPWPVTGDDNASWVPFAAASFSGPIGPSGMRFHDFRSNGVGTGAQILVTGASDARTVVTRIR